jgi:hypothetical protein
VGVGVGVVAGTGVGVGVDVMAVPVAGASPGGSVVTGSERPEPDQERERSLVVAKQQHASGGPEPGTTADAEPEDTGDIKAAGSVEGRGENGDSGVGEA